MNFLFSCKCLSIARHLNKSRNTTVFQFYFISNIKTFDIFGNSHNSIILSWNLINLLVIKNIKSRYFKICTKKNFVTTRTKCNFCFHSFTLFRIYIIITTSTNI